LGTTTPASSSIIWTCVHGYRQYYSIVYILNGALCIGLRMCLELQ